MKLFWVFCLDITYWCLDDELHRSIPLFVIRATGDDSYDDDIWWCYFNALFGEVFRELETSIPNIIGKYSFSIFSYTLPLIDLSGAKVNEDEYTIDISEFDPEPIKNKIREAIKSVYE